MSLWPIIIASKGRAYRCPTGQLLMANGIPFAMVVEPQEHEDYHSTFPMADFVVLDASDRGLWYARNACLAHARRCGWDWFWLLDDDIKQFGEAEVKRVYARTPRYVLSLAQMVLSDGGEFAQGALEYSQFSWSATQPLAVNGYCDVAVALRTSLVPEAVRFREMRLKVDRDFTLQLIAAGLDVARCRKLSFTCPSIGSIGGGLSRYYHEHPNAEREAAEHLASLWPDAVKAHQKPNGRWDAKIDWKKARA